MSPEPFLLHVQRYSPPSRYPQLALNTFALLEFGKQRLLQQLFTVVECPGHVETTLHRACTNMMGISMRIDIKMCSHMSTPAPHLVRAALESVGNDALAIAVPPPLAVHAVDEVRVHPLRDEGEFVEVFGLAGLLHRQCDACERSMGESTLVCECESM